MEKYLTPNIELVEISDEDIIITSSTIVLPWMPVQDEDEI